MHRVVITASADEPAVALPGWEHFFIVVGLWTFRWRFGKTGGTHKEVGEIC